MSLVLYILISGFCTAQSVFWCLASAHRYVCENHFLLCSCRSFFLMAVSYFVRIIHPNIGGNNLKFLTCILSSKKSEVADTISIVSSSSCCSLKVCCYSEFWSFMDHLSFISGCFQDLFVLGFLHSQDVLVWIYFYYPLFGTRISESEGPHLSSVLKILSHYSVKSNKVSSMVVTKANTCF